MTESKSKGSKNDKNKSKQTQSLVVVKTFAEASGVGPINDLTAQTLIENLKQRLLFVIQGSKKFTDHRKGQKLNCMDVEKMLKANNMKPLYGFSLGEYVPFKNLNGGGKDLYCEDDNEVFDLEKLASASMPKVPLEIGLKAHWMSIDGVQPNIPENPTPEQVFQLDILVNKKTPQPNDRSSKVPSNNPLLNSTQLESNNGKTKLKEVFSHELAVEQQLYYKEITEAAVGSDEKRRAEALNSLSSDPGLSQMLPRFSTFISEGVRVNVAQNNLALLIYLMRLMKALLDNPSFNLEKYLHELNPAIMTCIVSKQLCSRPDHDNHWALRDYAARIMGQVCKNYNTTCNQIQPKVCAIYCKCLYDDSMALSAKYGCVAGLYELGSEVVERFLTPRIKCEADRIEDILESDQVNSIDRTAAERLRGIIVKHTSQVIYKNIMTDNNYFDVNFEERYGFLGKDLEKNCDLLRQAEQHQNNLYASTGLHNRSVNLPSY